MVVAFLSNACSISSLNPVGWLKISHVISRPIIFYIDRYYYIELLYRAAQPISLVIMIIYHITYKFEKGRNHYTTVTSSTVWVIYTAAVRDRGLSTYEVDRIVELGKLTIIPLILQDILTSTRTTFRSPELLHGISNAVYDIEGEISSAHSPQVSHFNASLCFHCDARVTNDIFVIGGMFFEIVEPCREDRRPLFTIQGLFTAPSNKVNQPHRCPRYIVSLVDNETSGKLFSLA